MLLIVIQFLCHIHHRTFYLRVSLRDNSDKSLLLKLIYHSQDRISFLLALLHYNMGKDFYFHRTTTLWAEFHSLWNVFMAIRAEVFLFHCTSALWTIFYAESNFSTTTWTLFYQFSPQLLQNFVPSWLGVLHLGHSISSDLSALLALKDTETFLPPLIMNLSISSKISCGNFFDLKHQLPM